MQQLRQAEGRDEASGFATVLRQVAEGGSASHDYLAALLTDRTLDASRNLSDAIHLVCLLHGRHPGVLDYATWRAADDEARGKLEILAGWFDRERALLARLVVAVGPLPGTPGQASSESAVLAQRHALTMLAKSERLGCALGASVALVADWNAIRPLLDLVAERWMVPSGRHLAVESECASLFTPLIGSPAERAFAFAAEQLVSQHHALWDLLAARAAARAMLP